LHVPSLDRLYEKWAITLISDAHSFFQPHAAAMNLWNNIKNTVLVCYLGNNPLGVVFRTTNELNLDSAVEDSDNLEPL